MLQYLGFVISLLNAILGQYLSDCMKHALHDLPLYYQLSTLAEMRAIILRPGKATETICLDEWAHQMLKVLDDKEDQHYHLVYVGEHNGEPEEVVVRVQGYLLECKLPPLRSQE